MKKCAVIMMMLLLSSTSLLAKDKNDRKPSQDDGQTCVRFSGDGAKKTFMTLYPFTQGKVTAIVAEETKNGEVNIATENIFCRVYKTGLDKDLKKAMKTLNGLPMNKFQCGYFVSSEGDLSACSDPL